MSAHDDYLDPDRHLYPDEPDIGPTVTFSLSRVSPKVWRVQSPELRADFSTTDPASEIAKLVEDYATDQPVTPRSLAIEDALFWMAGCLASSGLLCAAGLWFGFEATMKVGFTVGLLGVLAIMAFTRKTPTRHE